MPGEALGCMAVTEGLVGPREGGAPGAVAEADGLSCLGGKEEAYQLKVPAPSARACAQRTPQSTLHGPRGGR